jgi:prepilin-type N-terminal cleavage/methylation domain-containing protein
VKRYLRNIRASLQGAFARGRRGFSLVEVLVVLVVITVGILPLAIVQTRARKDVTESDRYTRAVTLAQRQLEGTKGLGFVNAAADSGYAGELYWRTRIQDVDLGLRQVDVLVVIPRAGQPDTLRMAGLISIR